ncbi:DNA translocase FtsK [Neorhizobium alkalisoli]|uniref:DNA translocase FtsK n=1 Tax=Neorhizobium alkalisoli TaxID=528178 RepID=A0A561R771_9HYPH|nr:DNA translocase FtsK [Neorhizobium alkalisoli]
MRLFGSRFPELNDKQSTAPAAEENGSAHRDGAYEDPNHTARNPAATAADKPEDGAALPAWQKAFMLGPTVRFTRTPEKISNRGAGDQTAVEDAQATPAAPATAERPKTAPAFSAPRVTTPSIQAPQPAGRLPGARPLISDLRQALKAAEASSAPAQAPQSINPATPAHGAGVNANGINAAPAGQQRMNVIPNANTSAMKQQNHMGATNPAPAAQHTAAQPATATTPRRPMSYLPDHLLWEMLSLGPGMEAGAGESTSATHILHRNNQQLAAAMAERQQQAASVHPAAPVQAAAVEPEIRHPLAETGEAGALRLYREITLRSANQAPVEAAPETVETSPVAELVQEIPAQPVQSVSVPVSVKSIRPAPHFRVDTPVVDGYEFPSIELLQPPEIRQENPITQEGLEQSAGLLESVLEDFGIKGEIIDVRPGPVVTLYEFEPAPGVKSSRVIGLSEDIARSMSALSARVAVIPGRNVIGIELPNPVRETVYLRELVESETYANTGFRLPLCLGKTIGGEPVVAELAKMPHLLVAGTTGSGKSVAINTMILSLLYRYTPEQCRLIMIDPKMLELSVYDGIPHLLSPVVTDPKKAVLALKWAVREMEDRYRKMSRLNVRNIDGFNARVAQASASGETISINVPVGFDRQTGEQTFEQQDMDLTALPYIVVIVDEMADLMMVAGKEIEGAIQRLAQMARAAGIHIVMATQRPSVDVITGTIKANFPTRISFQVTSKIDSRTILGEQGAENLLGQGDMLHMMGGGRIARVHGPFVSDREVERIVAHLKTQGQPAYLGSVTEDEEEDEEEIEEAPVFDKSSMGEEDRDELYEQAIKVVMRDRKCSTSYIQRRLSVGYNRAASLVERMEKDGLVGPANHVGKREILSQRAQDRAMDVPVEDDEE